MVKLKYHCHLLGIDVTKHRVSSKCLSRMIALGESLHGNLRAGTATLLDILRRALLRRAAVRALKKTRSSKQGKDTNGISELDKNSGKLLTYLISFKAKAASF